MNPTQTNLSEVDLAEASQQQPEPGKPAAAPGELACPKCGGTRLRESETRRSADVLPSLTGQVPLRCRTCQHRFHAKLPKTMTTSDVKKKKRDRRQQGPFWRRPEARRRIAQIAIFCVSILLFSGFLVFLTNVGNN